MANKNIAVFGIYTLRQGVEDAVTLLRDAGYRHTDISVLFSENAVSKDLGTEKASKLPEGATTGASTGAVAGAVLGWLAGIGALTIPGVGPLIASGPIVAALAGAGAGGTVGGITGGLIGLGIPEYEAKRYEGRVDRGGILLSVHCDDPERAMRAKAIMQRSGADDISSTSEAAADFAKTDRPVPRNVTH